MGLRYLLLALALWGLFLIIRHLLRQHQHRARSVKPSKPKSVDSVQCAHCGLHLPREEALRRGERFFCSPAHLEADDQETHSD